MMIRYNRFQYERMKAPARSPRDVTRLMGIDAVFAIGRIASAQPRTFYYEYRSPFREASLSIAAHFALSGRLERGSTFLVTSAGANEGKSTSAFAMAAAFADLGKRVLLVDCDLRVRGQSIALGLEGNPGVSSIVVGQRSLADCIVPLPNFEFSFLPAGPGSSPVVPRILFDAVESGLFQSLRSHFDVIVIDSAPIMQMSDARILAHIADELIFIIEADRLNIEHVCDALDRLHIPDERTSCILTKMDFGAQRWRSWNYGDAYAYGYTYGGGSGWENAYGVLKNREQGEIAPVPDPRADG